MRGIFALDDDAFFGAKLLAYCRGFPERRSEDRQKRKGGADSDSRKQVEGCIEARQGWVPMWMGRIR